LSLLNFVVGWKLGAPLQSISEWPGSKYSIATDVAEILREAGADGKINEVRKMEFCEDGSMWLWNLFSFGEKNSMQAEVEEVMKNNDWITKTLFKALWITYIPGTELFHSPGAVSILEWWRVSHASYNVVWKEYGEQTESNVSRAYPEEVLQWMSLQKATIASIFNAFKWQFELSTSLMQAVVWILWEDIKKPEYYRWLYSHQWKSIGVSGSYVNHDMIEKIMATLDPFDAIKIDKISPIRQDKDTEEWVWRVDLLAWIFDELLARLVLHDVRDWEYQIQLVAEDIKAHFQKAQMNGSDELGKLC